MRADNRSAPLSAPDYTTAFLVMALVNLLWIFAVIWAAFGLQWVLAAGWMLNLGINRLARRRRG